MSRPSSNNELQEPDEMQILKSRIEKLKACLISLTHAAEGTDFKSIEQRFKINHKQHATRSSHINQSPTLDVDAEICCDIFRFAGFRCVHATKEQLVFHLFSGDQYKKENVFMVQILLREGKPSLGRSVLPPSVNIDILKDEAPLNTMKDIPVFLETCRQYVMCFIMRHEQYKTLEGIIKRKGSSSLQSDIGYTQVALTLLNVRDTRHNTLLNLSVELLYDVKEVRPRNIEVEVEIDNDLTSDTLKHFKKSLKAFKLEDLNTAFEKVLTMERGPFVWPPPSDSTVDNEMNSSDDSDEGFLDTLVRRTKRRKKSGNTSKFTSVK